MDRTRLIALALLCVAPASLPAQTQPRFAPARLARIDRFMQQYVDSGQIGGAVGLVLQDGRVVYQHAVGYVAKGLGPAAGWGWYTADKDEPICTTMERLGSLPFTAQPGERWVYGYNTDILGCVAERASGMPLDELIRSRITGPLQMNDTYF